MEPTKVKKPGKLRRVVPRVCATCKFFQHSGYGDSYCELDPDNRVWDTGDGDFWFVVCSSYQEGAEGERRG